MANRDLKSKPKTKLKDLIEFINFTHEFREVVRVARSPNGERFENDTEHSYQLAMVSWFVVELDQLRLNKELCFMYALAHDLVEIYAGDTYIFDKNKSNLDTKKKREKEALKKIEKRFPRFKKLVRIIEKYERKEDEESKLVYALDKILPPIQIYLEDGKLWHEKDVSFDQLVENKMSKMALSPEINAYWKELHKILVREKGKLFPR